MAKKSSAQLDREIADSLRKTRKPQASSRAARKANDAIYDLIHNKYFTSIPLTQLFEIVERAGLKFDDDEKSCILTGRDGKADWQLYDPSTGAAVDHKLVMTWHKMDTTGRYEVVAYVS